MPRPDFNQLQGELLRSGISPRHVRRTLLELDDHFEDLVDQAILQGDARRVAETRAMEQLGEMSELSRAVRARPELRSWAYRFPLLALVVYPLICVALLPLAPIVAGVNHFSYLMRWMASIVLSGIVTVTMLLVLQLAIALT